MRRIAHKLTAQTGIFAVLLTATACSTPGYNPAIDPNASPSPSPMPPPKKPPEEEKKNYEFECRVLNNEGRVFSARGTSEPEAESKARRSCQRYYRRCTIMRCDVVQVVKD